MCLAEQYISLMVKNSLAMHKPNGEAIARMYTLNIQSVIY